MKKCNILGINNNEDIEITLHEEKLKLCNEYKYLGLWYSNKGNLDAQIKH